MGAISWRSLLLKPPDLNHKRQARRSRHRLCVSRRRTLSTITFKNATVPFVVRVEAGTINPLRLCDQPCWRHHPNLN